jgi:hypothetical protein
MVCLVFNSIHSHFNSTILSMIFRSLILSALVMLMLDTHAQSIQQYNLSELAKNNKLELFNRELTPVAGGKAGSIQLSAKPGDGVAWLKGVDFTEGVIEFDIKGKDVLQKSFVGIAFHSTNDTTYDAIYFRPFNFRSTDSVRRIHAVQYVAEPYYTWERLRKEQNAQYEKAVDPVPDPNEWFHVKIEILYPQVMVYVNGNARPSLTIKQLNERRSGKIGLMVGHESDGSFANLSLQIKK